DCSDERTHNESKLDRRRQPGRLAARQQQPRSQDRRDRGSGEPYRHAEEFCGGQQRKLPPALRRIGHPPPGSPFPPGTPSSVMARRSSTSSSSVPLSSCFFITSSFTVRPVASASLASLAASAYPSLGARAVTSAGLRSSQ